MSEKSLVVKHIVMPGYEQARKVLCLDDELPTIQVFIDQSKWSFKLPTICVVNGVPVLRTEWATRKIERGDHISFLSKPWGGNKPGGVSKSQAIIGIVALVALSAFAAWAGPALGAAMGLTGSSLTIGGQLITAGIVLGGSLLISTLIYPKAGSANNPVDQLFSLTAAGNVAKPLTTIPVQYGKLKTFPDYAMTPYSDYANEYQYLNLLFSLGPGKFHIHQIFIDTTIIASETPYADFSQGPSSLPFTPGALFEGRNINPSFYGTGGVPWQAPNFGSPTPGPWITYYDPGQQVTLFAVNEIVSPSVSGQSIPGPADFNPWLGGFIVNDAGTLATGIWIDVAFPAGLFVQNSSGSLFSARVQLEIQAQQVDDGGGPITSYGDIGDPIFENSTQQPWRQSFFFQVGPGRYQVRLRRTTTPARELKQPDGNGNTTVDEIVWLGLRAQLQGTNVFPDVTTLAIRILATNQLSQESSVHIGVLATRILPVWNGSEMVEQPSQSPAWAFYDAAVNTQYGAARPPEKIDFQAIVDLHDSAGLRNDACNIQFASAVPVPEAFDTILATTRCKHRWAGDILTLVRDEQVAVPQMLLTDRQIVRDSMNISYIFNDDITTDSVIVQYLDEASWLPAEVQYPPNGNPPGFVSTQPARVQMQGITNRAQAAREAAFLYLQAFYRRVKIQLDTEHDGRLLNLGSVVRVQSELPQSWGSSGIVTALTFDGVNYSLTVDPAPDWPASGTCFVNIRTPQGAPFGPIQCLQGLTTDIIILDNADLATVTNQQNMNISQAVHRQAAAEEATYDFGVGTAVSRTCIVLQGQPRGDAVTLQLVVDNPLVHTTDLADIPPLPPGNPLLNPDVPIIAGLLANFRQGVAEPILDATWFPAKGAFSYVAQVSYDGTTWIEIYSGVSASLSEVVQYAGLTLRVAGLSNVHGAWTQVTVAPPTIVINNPVVGLQSLLAGLSDYVTGEFNRVTDAISTIQQLIATAGGEQDAANWIDKYNTKVLAAANYGSLSASIATNTAAIATQDAAIASFETSVTATVGSINANVTENATAIATIEGKLAAQWTVTVNVNNYISGIQLYDNGTDANLIFVADNLQFAFPGQPGGTPVPVFQIGNVNGAAKIVFRGDMYADGNITARNMAVGSIDASNIIVDDIIVTGHLVADAATAVAYAAGANFTFPPSNQIQYQTIASIVFDVAVGPVDIIGTCTLISSPVQGVQDYCPVQIAVDGIVRGTWNAYSQIVGAASSPPSWAWTNLVVTPLLINLPVGTHTITLQLHPYPGHIFGQGGQVISPAIRVLESRR